MLHSRNGITLLAAIAALLVGVVSAVVWREVHRPVERAQAMSSPLSLRAEQAGGSLRVYWERSLAQRQANSGVLLIVDGEETIRRVVGPAEIQSGGLSYRPVTGDVTLILSAYGPGGFAASQALRWIEPSHPEIQPVARKETSNRPAARRARVVDNDDDSDILPPKRPRRPSPFSHQTTVAAVAPPAPAFEPASKPVEAPKHVDLPKHIEKPAPPRRPEVAESMPVTDSGESTDRGGLKKSLRWLGAKTSRIRPFGRKPASD